MHKARSFFINFSGPRQDIRFFFLLFCSLKFQTADAEISFCYDGRNEGHRLNSTVYDHRHALSRIDCVVQCVQEPCCRSTNYRKSHSFDGKENCELLHAVLSEQLAEDLKEDKDYDYNIVLEPIKSFDCQCSSCENNGNCDTSTKQCSCLQGFTGNQCKTADPAFPIWPHDFRWTSDGPLAGYNCVQIKESADPDSWHDNYFCSVSHKMNPGMRWSSAGKINDMRCTQIKEATDPGTWNDNFLCVPHNSPLQFQWSSAGSIAGNKCIQWHEAADPHSWVDNYLCG